MTLHIETPLFESPCMSMVDGQSVLLKMECFQPTGSFKIRGIGLLCQEYVEQGVGRLVCSSGGNAGFAVAYAGKRLGVPVTVAVPETTPDEVCRRIRSESAEVLIHGTDWDETHEFALELSQKTNCGYVPPFDHSTLWRGHSTLVDEIVAQGRKPDAVVVSVGGGGLLCGVIEGLSRHGWQDVAVIAVETAGTRSLARSLEAGKLVTLNRIGGVATSLGAKRVAARALALAQTHNVVPWVVTDSTAVSACLRFARDHRVLVEPACGASLSVVYDKAEVIEAAGTVLVVVCGGIGVNVEKLLEWQAEFSSDGPES